MLLLIAIPPSRVVRRRCLSEVIVDNVDADVLLVIDVQNDFCAGGSLAVPGGDDVVPLINEIAKDFRHVVLTQDWHPPGHLSFASSHKGREAFSQIDLPYGPQTLWPDHCVQNKPGAALHKGLNIPQTELVIRKGFRREIDSYSAFFENDHKTPTGLAGYFKERGFKKVYLAGLAFDFNGSAEATRKLFRYRDIELI
jgi:nicotinamidase/pyrazinamidase